jgi:hypothetical protein
MSAVSAEPRAFRMGRCVLIGGLCVAALFGFSAEKAFAQGAIITNNVVELGVHETGELNFCCKTEPGSHTSLIGVRVFETPGNAASRSYESTADGCPCEGWGVADAGTGVTGWANQQFGGPHNLALVSFTSTASTAISVVNVLNGSGTPVMQVTQNYHPSTVTSQAYEDTVTIKNLTGSSLSDIRYRRTMDWDIEPTQFDEFVTVTFGSPPPTNLRHVTDNGFDQSDPLSSNSPGDGLCPECTYDSGQPPATTLTDNGPSDHGANFDFGFGSLAAGQSKTFNVYYGGAASSTNAETIVNTALAAIGAETYSIGESSTPDGPTKGTPAAFLFAFGGVGGEPPANKPGKVSARGTVSSSSGQSVQFSAANNCDKDLSTRGSQVAWPGNSFAKTAVTSSSCFDDPGIPGTPSSGFDTQTGKASGHLANGAAATLEWKYVDGAPGSSPSDKVQFVVRNAGGTALLTVNSQSAGPLSGTPGGVWTFAP